MAGGGFVVEPKKIVLGIRPEHIVLTDAGHKGAVPAKVDVSEMMGSSVHLHLDCDGKDVIAIVQTQEIHEVYKDGFPVGREVSFAFDGNVVHMFSKEGTEKNLEF